MYSRPQLLDLINRIRADMLSRFAADDTLRRSDAEVYARAEAGGMNELYGYLDWLSRQVIYDTADGDILIRWASIWGLSQKAAVAASGTIAISGSEGATLPSGSTFQAADGVQYGTIADATISGGTATANLVAIAAGAAGNRASGQTFTLLGPVAGIIATGLAAQMSGGADLETVDALRARFLARIRQPPQGGSSADYVGWALEVAGFTRAWCYAQELGPGTVTVRGMCDNSYTNGIPQSVDITALQNHLNIVRPVTASVTAVAPIPDTLNFTIAGLSPPTAAVEAAITTALAALIRAEGQPGGTLLLSHIQGAIDQAGAVYDFSLASPSANVVSATGHIPIMGAITWA